MPSVSWRALWLDEAVGELLDIARTDRRQADRIHRAVQTLARTEQGDMRKLTVSSDEWRLRVGDWRVIFSFERVAQSMTVLTLRRRNEGTYRD
jgi:mRNA-degrading endonuclease RelE of RelBE toxin-antitoxin system